MNSLRHLFPYILNYKTRLIWGLVAITISNVFSVAIPRYIGHVVDHLLRGPQARDWFSAGAVTETYSSILALKAELLQHWFPVRGLLEHARVYAQHHTNLSSDWILSQVLIILGLSMGSGIFLFLTRQTIIVMSRYVEYDLRNDFMSRVQALPMSYFTSTPTGDVMALATNDINAVREFCGPALMYTANTITIFSFSLVMMLTLSVKITLLALLPLPLVSYTVYHIGRKIHVLFTQVQKQYGDLTSQAQETLSGVRVVRTYVREVFSAELFTTMSLSYKDKNLRLVKTQSLMMPLMGGLIGLSLLIVLGVGGSEVIAGRASVGDISQFFAYISQLIWPVIAVGWVANLVQRASASMERLNRVMSLEPEKGRAAASLQTIGNGSPNVLMGRVEFRGVTFRYLPGLPDVLTDVNFTVEPGTVLAIVGSTGAGKSTIVDLLARLYEPTSGQVLIDGRPVSEIPLSDLRNSLGVVAQETFLFSETIEGNIRFGMDQKPLADVVEAAEIAQLHESVLGFPEKYGTFVGERGITLSGGQKQRVSLARAILRQPKILILDDSMSAIDTETEELILERLRGVMRSRTSIIIAHRISTVKDADMIIVLQDGRIVEKGTHEQLIGLNGHYAEMNERQMLEEQLAAF